MIPEERRDGPGAGEESTRLQAADSVRKGGDPLAQTQRGCLQSHRARVHQQISKELQMRAGAENLYRATSNTRVRETVALELSYVNSRLQLLKEELEELDCGGDADGPGSGGSAVPLIPLGLKETQELDWSAALRELISGHFGEDGTTYEAEIRSWPTCGRPCGRPAGARPAWSCSCPTTTSSACWTPASSAPPGAWGCSSTGTTRSRGPGPAAIGAHQDRTCPGGARRAAEAFQRAAGAFSLLREKFSHAPSPDMSAASLCVLEQLMTAQAQECVFEGLSLPAPAAPHDCLAQLRLAQEAAQVAAEYEQVRRAMAQPPVRDYVPFAWTALVMVKAEHFRALAHFHAATALCGGPPAEAELLVREQEVFLEPPDRPEPQRPALALPREPEERRKLGKAHLRRAILGQEAALRLHAVGRALRRVDPLQAVLAQALRRSLAKYSELDLEDDFFEAPEAPDIQPKTYQRPEVRAPSFSQVEVADIFHRLGPLSVFSAKNRWRLVGPVHVTRGEGGFGFTLRGDAPVLIAAVIPGGRAAAAGLQEGDYIVAVDGQPCRWWKHAEVVARLKGVGEEGVSLQVASLLPNAEPPGPVSPALAGGLHPQQPSPARGPAHPGGTPNMPHTPPSSAGGHARLLTAVHSPDAGDRRPALRGLLRSQERGWEPAPARASPRPLLGWSRKAKRGKTGGRPSPAPQP
ncbi:hypothetical protein QTO34_007510 [Cnephaeus nilssonii]|uniref:Rhophilin Rho GTPase binding protein 1 n=1 Tax=Cnephaeus nilssonii TaxID=3371016 RepID=A0AA40HIH2_CNENI|nr:hypothetical protein QTO34_007510 [Eptesicus nilssonii]